MNKNIYVLPVSATFRDIKYPELIIKSPDALERRLQGKNLDITLGKELEGQTMAQVYAAKLDGKHVIVKHIENVMPSTPIEFLIMSDAFATEMRVLKRLSTVEHIKVPRVLEQFPKFTTFIMDDMRSQGYTSLSRQITDKKLSIKSAEHIGTALAHLAQMSQTWEEFKTNESAQLNYYERSLEMLIAYPHDLKRYRHLESEFSQFSEDKEEQEKLKRFFVWPDSNPHNMLVNDAGEVVFVDFGRSYWGDQRYMLAAFLAHIILYSLLGFIPHSKAEDYIQRTYTAYTAIESITDEKMLVTYMAMELLHQAQGKYIHDITTADQKSIIQKCGMHILDTNVKTVKTVLSLVKKLSN